MNILNQFSYVFGALFIIIIVVITLRGLLHRSLLLTGGIAALLVILATAGFLVLRPGNSDVNSVEDAISMIESGKPTLVEFYSNYCAGCMAARPAVDQLVNDIQARYQGNFNVLRIDIHTDFGRDIRERYGFSFSPEFVLFDQQGQEVWRSHTPPSLDEIDQLAQATVSTAG